MWQARILTWVISVLVVYVIYLPPRNVGMTPTIRITHGSFFEVGFRKFLLGLNEYIYDFVNSEVFSYFSMHATAQSSHTL